MCLKVACKDCGKFSWIGCGKHLKTLYASIDKGQHCMCKSWPGIIVPTEDIQQQSTQEATTEASKSDVKA